MASKHQNRRVQIKSKFHDAGITVKDWARNNGFSYVTVREVITGRNQATRGKGHKIAVALGLKHQRNTLRGAL